MRTQAAVVVIMLFCLSQADPIDGAEAPKKHTRGWRGPNGNGHFPDAEPLLKWGRISRTLKGLTTQSEKPKDQNAPGTNPAIYGNVREWLVLGPIPCDSEMKKEELLAKAFVPNEASLQPDLGETLAGAEWRKLQSNGSLVNLNRHYKDMKNKVFYAHAYVHSKTGGRVLMRVRGPVCRFWLNGKVIHEDVKKAQHPIVDAEFKQGWNSLLIKVFTTRKITPQKTLPAESAFFQLIMWGHPEDNYEEKNILWSVSLPQAIRFSCAQPIIVGDRVFVNADPSFLICYDKMTGKRLWIDYCGHYEFVTDEERTKYPDLFKEIDPKVKRVKELIASWKGNVEEDIELTKHVGDLRKLFKKVDRKKYAHVGGRQEAGQAGLCSVTDGKFIYTWYADMVAVCHDLDGNRKWIVLENERRGFNRSELQRHGLKISPLLTDTEFVVPSGNWIAFNKETGEVKWKMKRHHHTARLPGDTAITAEATDCVFFRNILGLCKPGVGLFTFGGWHSSTIMGNKAYGGTYNGYMVYDISKTLTADTKLKGRNVRFPRSILTEKNGRFSHEWGYLDGSLLTPGSWSAHGVAANHLIDNGLVYLICMGGPLMVFDDAKGELLYAVRPGLNTMMWAYPYPHGSGVCASPTLGGKHIYIFGNGGTTWVIKPGRTLEIVAKNRIERLMPGHKRSNWMVPSHKGFYPECTVSSPIFDGKRIYYQGEGFLYCIGKPEDATISATSAPATENRE